jgi:hypothetical protein
MKVPFYLGSVMTWQIVSDEFGLMPMPTLLPHKWKVC